MSELISRQSLCEPMQRRTFQEIVVEYPLVNMYSEYPCKPYFSIKYTENGQEYIGYGTYNPEILSEYLKEYFIPPIENENDTGSILNTDQQQTPDTSPVCGEGCEYFTDYNGNQGEYKQMSEIKTWKVRYEHKDGRKGTVDVVTEIEKRENTYGNGKYGRLSVEGFSQIYDLRYATGDLHKLMLKSYFGSGLISTE